MLFKFVPFFLMAYSPVSIGKIKSVWAPVNPNSIYFVFFIVMSRRCFLGFRIISPPVKDVYLDVLPHHTMRYSRTNKLRCIVQGPNQDTMSIICRLRVLYSKIS